MSARLVLMITGRERLRGFLAAMLSLFVLASFGCARITQHFDEEPEIQNPQAAAPPAESVHLFLGNPSNAVQDENSPENFLIIGDGSALSYNNTRGTANWISWRTLKNDLGPSLRRPDFSPDLRLPAWYKRIYPGDYSGSGYDRGHLVPSADRFGNAEMNQETFLMTNIVPQTSALNQYPWEKLESYARGQARRGFDVYQIAGVYGNKGILKDKVVVPTNCWKIIVILPAGTVGIENANGRARVLAVDMPNEDNIERQPWERFRTTIRAIEERTGYDFFAQLPRGLQDELETRKEISNRRN